LRVFYFIQQNWPFGSLLCKLSVSLFYTNMYGSILFLTCISVDRFLAIVHPFRSRGLRTKRNAKIVCVAVWILVLSGSLPTGFMLDSTNKQNNSISCFENFSSKQWKSHLSKVVIFIETVGFLIPLILNIATLSKSMDFAVGISVCPTNSRCGEPVCSIFSVIAFGGDSGTHNPVRYILPGWHVISRSMHTYINNEH